MTGLESLMEYWNELPRFNEPNDVPHIPIVDTEIYKEFFIPKIIELGGIPKSELIDGKTYIGNHRNCTEARWDAAKNNFVYERHKFTFTFEDVCNHFEDDNGFALFVPIKIKK